MIEFKKASDPIGAFVLEMCKMSGWITRADLLDAQGDYMEQNGLEEVKARPFTKYIREMSKVKDEQRKVEGKNARVWTGISLKTDVSKPEVETEKTTLSFAFESVVEDSEYSLESTVVDGKYCPTCDTLMVTDKCSKCAT